MIKDYSRITFRRLLFHIKKAIANTQKCKPMVTQLLFVIELVFYYLATEISIICRKTVRLQSIKARRVKTGWADEKKALQDVITDVSYRVNCLPLGVFILVKLIF